MNKISNKEDYTAENNQDGLVRWFYPDGKLKAECNYEAGKLHGISNYYFENGNIKARENYKEGKLHGLCKTYFETGEIQTEVYYKFGVLIKDVHYDITGKITSQKNR